MLDICTIDPTYILLLVGTGIVSGFFSGVLGVGGGTIFVPIGFFVLSALGMPESTALLTSFGVSLAAIIPTSITSAITHTKNGNVAWKPTIIIGICGLVAAICGGIVANIINTNILIIIFGIILILSGIKIISKIPSGTRDTLPKSLSAIIGTISGFCSGLFGIGGGIILVPLMTLCGKFTFKRATATSSAAIVFITLGALPVYLFQGFFNLLIWGIFVITSIPSAYLSAAKLSPIIPEKILRISFFMLMIGMALKLFGVYDWIAS